MSRAAKTAPTGVKPGRKPINDGEAMQSRTFRTTDDEWQKCLALGGADWLRAKINAAKDPRK